MMIRYTPVLILPVLLVISSAVATTEFEPEQLLFVNNRPLAASAAPLDGDADLDLVISGDTGLMVSWNLDGAGTFSGPVRVGDAPSGPEFVADLNGDDDPDILSVQIPGPSRTIVWHRNEGGVFTEAITLRTENASLGMLPPTDVDGDMDLDLIWYDGSTEVIEWMENTDGAGTFSSAQTLQAVPDILFPRLIDLNEDGVPDFVGKDWKGTGLGSDDELVWLPGQGTSNLSFGAARVFSPAGYAAVAFGTLNDDAQVDLVVTGPTSDQLKWIRNEGSGAFSAPLPIVALGGVPASVSLVDLDHDGHTDLLFSMPSDSAYWCRHTDGMGTFDAPAALAAPEGSSFDSIAAARLDADLLPDLLTSEETLAAWHPQTGSGTTLGPARAVVAAVDDITAVATMKLDGDPDLDVVFATKDGTLQALTNLGEGAFAGAERLLAGQTDLEVIVAAQLDGQGGDDLVALRPQANRVDWHAGDGAGGIGGSMLIDDFGVNPTAAAVEDFNGDGAPDVAVAFTDDNVCSWYAQDPATHAFTFKALSGTLGGVRAIAAGDINGDTHPDIVTAAFSAGTVHAYTNVGGSGTFSPAMPLGSASAGIDQVEIAEVNGDGRPDVLALESSGTDTTITAFFNDGVGAFPSNRIVYTVSAGVTSMDVGDLDLDGDLDLVTANANSDRIHWLENDGNGFFSAQALTAAPGSSPYTVALVDLDGDGDLDVLNVSRFRRVVGWYRNRYRPPPPKDDSLTVWAWDLGVAEEHLDPGSDSDGDGVSLLEEFAWNMDPRVPDRMVVAEDGASGTPELWFTFGTTFYRARGRFIRRRDYQDIGLSYLIERSPDLQTWTNLGTGTRRVLDDDYERVTFNRILSGKPSIHFTTLRIEYNPPE